MTINKLVYLLLCQFISSITMKSEHIKHMIICETHWELYPNTIKHMHAHNVFVRVFDNMMYNTGLFFV